MADIHPTTYELRLGILIEKAQKRGVEIPPKVLEFLSHRIISNVREMEGALNRLVAHATLVGTEITIETAQVVLQDLLKSSNKKITIEEIQKKCANFLLKYEWVKNTYTASQLHENEYSNSFHSLVQRGYNQKRSGDVIVSLQTGWLKTHWESGGTTHGSSYSYDTHVPLIFWGGDIPKGRTDRKVNIRDIAPTISMILGTAYPNGCTGNPLHEITE